MIYKKYRYRKNYIQKKEIKHILITKGEGIGNVINLTPTIIYFKKNSL